MTPDPARTPSTPPAVVPGPEQPSKNERRAAAFRAESRAGDGKPEGTRDSIVRCAAMLDTYAPDLYPANELGQIDFARAMMESTADEIRAYYLAVETRLAAAESARDAVTAERDEFREIIRQADRSLDDGVPATVYRGEYDENNVYEPPLSLPNIRDLEKRLAAVEAALAAEQAAAGRLREALKPLGSLAKWIPPNWPDACELTWNCEENGGYSATYYAKGHGPGGPTIGDIRRAALTLASPEPNHG